MDWYRFVNDLSTDLQGDNLAMEYEERLVDFDYERDAPDLLYHFLQPQLDEIRKTLLDSEEKAKQIYRDAGLSDIEIAWKKFDHVKLGWKDAKRLKKIADKCSLLVDAEIGLWALRNVILKHRPDLQVEIGQMVLIPDQ